MTEVPITALPEASTIQDTDLLVAYVGSTFVANKVQFGTLKRTQVPVWTYSASAATAGLFKPNFATIMATTDLVFSISPQGAQTSISAVLLAITANSSMVLTHQSGETAVFQCVMTGSDSTTVTFSVSPLSASTGSWLAGEWGVSFWPLTVGP